MNKEFKYNAIAIVISVVALFFGDNLREQFGMLFVVKALVAVAVAVASCATLKLFDWYWSARRTLAMLTNEAKELLFILGKQRGFIVEDSRKDPPVSINDTALPWCGSSAIDELEARGLVTKRDDAKRIEKDKRGALTQYSRRSFFLNDKGATVCRFARK